MDQKRDKITSELNPNLHIRSTIHQWLKIRYWSICLNDWKQDALSIWKVETVVNTYTKRFIYMAAPLSMLELLVLTSRDSPLMTSALLLPNVRRHLICNDFNIKNNK